MNLFDDEVKEDMADALLQFLQGDTEAVSFCMELLWVYHLWDDLYDGDKDRTQDDINAAFFRVFHRLRTNTFFRQYQDELYPLITSSILQWMDSNALEQQGDRHELHKAYMLRAFIYQIWNYCAFLIGGFDYYKEVGPVMQKIYIEPFEDYVKEFEKCPVVAAED